MDEKAATAAGSAPERRHVLRAGALGAAAVAGGVALSGCGTSEPSTSSAEAGDGADASAGRGGIPVADVPVGGGTVVAGDKVVVTQPTEGTFKAFDVTCPHQGCAVSMVTGDGIVCPCHGSVFDVATGERRSGPAQRGLTPRDVAVIGDRLTLS
ncbi:MAG TPA: Rieske (2Fe-2S) protein [Dermatophilaceae bacterium]|nr:Rieske (2Fe-2S) protein [Dermatophilaceae bacterium]